MTPEEANDRMQIVHLSGIDRAASNVSHYAETVQHYTSALRSTPCFDTLAEEAIGKAEAALTIALQKIQEARRAYRDAPQS